jgi:hypothetical protein
MFTNLLLNLGFAHLFGTPLSLANLALLDLLLKLDLVLLFLLDLTSTSKPSSSLVDLHFLKL